MTLRRRPAIGAALLASTLLVGCTPAVSPNAPADPFVEPVLPRSVDADNSQSAVDLAGSQSALGLGLGAPKPEKGTGTVVLAVLAGAVIPEDLATSFHEASGFDLEIHPLSSVDQLSSSDADVVMGLGIVDAASASQVLTPTPPFTITAEAGAPQFASTVAYGRDDVCVLADRGWMSANQKTLPSGFASLAAADVASLLVMPDPSASAISQTFLLGASRALGDGVDEWVKALQSGGTLRAGGTEVGAAFRALESGQSSGADARPLALAPMSVIAEAKTTPGAESRAAALNATCVERYLYAGVLAGAREQHGAVSLLAWLDSTDGQQLLAASASAYPLDTRVVSDTAAEWFLSPLLDAQTVTLDDIGRVGELASLWAAN